MAPYSNCKLHYDIWIILKCHRRARHLLGCLVYQCSPSCDPNIGGLVQDYSNSIANALKLLQSCTKQWICSWPGFCLLGWPYVPDLDSVCLTGSSLLVYPTLWPQCVPDLDSACLPGPNLLVYPTLWPYCLPDLDFVCLTGSSLLVYPTLWPYCVPDLDSVCLTGSSLLVYPTLWPYCLPDLDFVFDWL